MLTLTKEYIKNDDLSIYTIELDDGQKIVINQYEFETLKEGIKTNEN